jgi:pyruvate/2-oxoglutarate dehydrogenase complex dihydrolipoamide acyltransferase (E2) component
VPIVVPDLGIRDVPVVVSLWLVARGERVEAGDRVVELLADGVTVDLEAPVAGRLGRLLVEEDDPVAAGDVIGEILPAETS